MAQLSSGAMQQIAGIRKNYITYFNNLMAMNDIGSNGLIRSALKAGCLSLKYRYDANKDEVVIGELKVRKSAGRRTITLPYGFDTLDCKVTGNGCADIWFLDLSNIKNFSDDFDLSEFTNLKKIKFDGLAVKHIYFSMWNGGLKVFGLKIADWTFQAGSDGKLWLVK